MAQLKWSYGESLKKSYPQDKTKNSENNKTSENNKINDDDELFNPKTPYTFMDKDNKKEDINSSINDRYLVKRNFQNPFFLDHDYLKDIETRDKFLLPQISNNKTASNISL